MGLAGSVARTSYILPGTLETENQMLFLVVSRGIIMLSLGKNKIVISSKEVHTHHFCWKGLQYSHREPQALSTSLAHSPGKTNDSHEFAC